MNYSSTTTHLMLEYHNPFNKFTLRVLTLEQDLALLKMLRKYSEKLHLPILLLNSFYAVIEEIVDVEISSTVLPSGLLHFWISFLVREVDSHH